MTDESLKELIFQKLLLSESMLHLFQMFDENEIKLDREKRIFNQTNMIVNGVYKGILKKAGLLDEYYDWAKKATHT